jgi:hypothetical protein
MSRAPTARNRTLITLNIILNSLLQEGLAVLRLDNRQYIPHWSPVKFTLKYSFESLGAWRITRCDLFPSDWRWYFLYKVVGREGWEEQVFRVNYATCFV